MSPSDTGRQVVVDTVRFVLPVVVLPAVRFTVLCVFITPNVVVYGGCGDPRANDGGHASHEDCGIDDGRQQPQS